MFNLVNTNEPFASASRVQKHGVSSDCFFWNTPHRSKVCEDVNDFLVFGVHSCSWHSQSQCQSYPLPAEIVLSDDLPPRLPNTALGRLSFSFSCPLVTKMLGLFCHLSVATSGDSVGRLSFTSSWLPSKGDGSGTRLMFLLVETEDDLC